MTYNFTYAGDSYKRVIWGVVADSRANIPTVKNQNGFTIKAYVDSQISLVTAGVSVYKLETTNGNLAGYIGLSTVPGSVGLVFSQFRPAFMADLTNLIQNIANFINGNNWLFDTLS